MSFPDALILAGYLAATAGIASPHPTASGWGAVVGEPGLDAMIASALDQSSSIAGSRMSTRVRALETRLSRTARHPSIDLGATWRTGREDTASTGFEEADVAPWDLGGTARLDLDVFGALKARTRGAFQSEQIAEFELRDHELAWAAEMTRVLVQLRYREHEEEARAAMVETQRINRDWARNRRDAGLVSTAELDVCEARLLQARQDHVAASEQRDVLGAHWHYLAATNRIPDASSVGTGNIPQLPSPEELHDLAMNRPDVQAAYAAWQRADHQATASRKARQPTLSAVASARGEGPSPVQDPEEWTAWAGLQLALPLWAPDDRARADRDREQIKLEEAMYHDVALAALKDLQQAYARRWNAERTWVLASEEVTHARDRLATAQRTFDHGLIMRAQLESVRNHWLAAADRARHLRASLLMHHVDLVRAAGGPGS